MVGQGLQAPATALGSSLGPRMGRAAAWLLGSQFGSQLLRLAGNLLLARLLAPDAFGLMAALNTLYFALVMFSDLGLWQIVVQSQRSDPRFLGTVWALQLIRALLLATVVLAIALTLPLLAGAGWLAAGSAFADPRLPPMVAAFALCALLQGGESVKLALAQRELQGAALARLELLAQLLALGLTLALAWHSRSPWALAAGAVLSAAVRSLGSHLMLAGPRAWPCWDRAALRELLGLGRWMVASSLLGFLAAHVEKLLLGALLVTTSFGLFSIASILVGAVAGLFASLNGQVVMAGLSLARREEPAALAETYARLQRRADLALGAGCGLMLTLGPWIVLLGYDARYHGAAWMLQLLSLGLIAIRQQVAEQLMFVLGQPQRVSANNLVRGLALMLLVPAGLQLGGERGALVAVLLCQFAAWPLTLRFLHREGLLRWRSSLSWLPALLLAAALGALLSLGLQALRH